MLPTHSASAFTAASANVSCLNTAVEIPTRHPNQIFSSAPPSRIVPRLEPEGLTDADPAGDPEGCGGVCPPPGLAGCAKLAIPPAIIRRAAARKTLFILFFLHVRLLTIALKYMYMRGMLSAAPLTSQPVAPGGAARRFSMSWRYVFTIFPR